MEKNEVAEGTPKRRMKAQRYLQSCELYKSPKARRKGTCKRSTTSNHRGRIARKYTPNRHAIS